MKVAFFTLGCKVNQYESQEMLEVMRNNNFEVVSDKDMADIYIINSCTVTAESTRKSRQAVRHFRRRNKDAIIVLTGCMPQSSEDIAKALPEADIIIGNKNNLSLISNLNRYIAENTRLVDLHEHKSGDLYKGSQITSFDEHTRAFVKIQDGCDRFCSYCIIPYVRGRSRSKHLNEIEKELENLALNGYREIVFVGINLSDYGKDFNKNICDAIEIAENIEGIERLRLGSLEPDHITSDILNRLKAFKKFCPHFHLSLQSGSDGVLKRMNRKYTSADFENLVKSIRSAFADAAITTDIIVGFPSETEEEFEQTLNFVKKIRFDKVHIFPYSIRPGTKAAKMPNQIIKSIKSERASALISECDKIRKEIFKSQIGKTFSVFIESPKMNKSFGYTKNYLPVLIEDGILPQNTLAEVTITAADDECCIGHVN